MALIHTVQINGNARMGKVVNATRKSDSRRYVACLVCTVTEATLAHDAAAKDKATRELVDWRVKFAERTAKHGMTVAQAKAWHEAADAKWYGKTDDETGDRVENGVTFWTVLHELQAKNPRFYGDLHEPARKEMVKRGFPDPFASESPYGISEAAGCIESLERSLASWTAPVIGVQGVLSWHGTVGNAQKALGARETGWHRDRGYKIEIRTDITVRETVKRASKAVSS